MSLEIRELRKKDYKKAIQFAITGMHFNWFMDNRLLLNLYGRYFWYMEVNRATQVIAAYEGDVFAGVLLAEIRGEARQYRSFGKMVYVGIFDLLQNVFVKGGTGVYDQANREMLSRYCERSSPDGEILFLAANPEIKAKGVGSALLRELEQRENGKVVYLYTDNACTYQFYEHRGFERAGEKDVVLSIAGREVALQCLLYSKRMGG